MSCLLGSKYVTTTRQLAYICAYTTRMTVSMLTEADTHTMLLLVSLSLSLFRVYITCLLTLDEFVQ